MAAPTPPEPMLSPPVATNGAAGQPRRRSAGVTGAVIGAVLVVAVVGGLLWRRASGAGAITPDTSVAAPNDTSSGGTGPVAVADAAVKAAKNPTRDGRSASRLPTDSTPASRQADASRSDTTTTKQGAGDPAGDRSRVRDALDRLKATLADPVAVEASGQGAGVLATIERLLPTLTARADSVEATYYAIETNLILDRPADACRLLVRVRTAARATEYEGKIERYLADTDLGCSSRPD